MCPISHNQVFSYHIPSDKHVSLYFIPLVPYGSNQHLAVVLSPSWSPDPPGRAPRGRHSMHVATTAFRTSAQSASR